MDSADEDLAFACNAQRGDGERHAAWWRYEIQRWADAVMLLHFFSDRLVRLKIEDLDREIRVGVEIEVSRRTKVRLPPPPFGVYNVP